MQPRSRRSGRSHDRAGVLVVRLGTTLGHDRSEDALVGALDSLGVPTAQAVPSFGALGRLRLCYPLIDLIEAFAVHRAVAAMCRDGCPASVVYPTTLSALFEPRHRLNRAAVRFDSLARDNRSGMRNVLQRRLERRVLREAAILLPLSAQAMSVRAFSGAWEPLPTPVAMPRVVVEKRSRVVLCYGSNLRKKGIDVVLDAWRRHPLPGYRLVVCGVDEATATAQLGQARTRVPDVSWLGSVSRADFRALTASAEIFVCASRYEDFGLAQLEALADGAVVVSARSAGGFEAGRILAQVDADLLVRPECPKALSVALHRAAALSDSAKSALRHSARTLLTPYSEDAFRDRLRDDILPSLRARAQLATGVDG